MGRVGKADFVETAMAIEWKDFDCSGFRTLDLGDVVVVDYEIGHEIGTASETGAKDAPGRTSWIMTDVWALEHQSWRLVARHPEPRTVG
jgi:hypothetical protein